MRRAVSHPYTSHTLALHWITPSGMVLAKRHQQRGVTLMILLLVVTLGSAAVMLHELNQRARGSNGQDLQTLLKSRAALKQARDALLGAAISDVPNPKVTGSPERPGQLPWPDRERDGNYDGYSDCVPSNFRDYHLLGRFPHFGEAVPDENGHCGYSSSTFPVIALDTIYQDGSGEPLWYAVSRNLLNQGTENLEINPDLVDNPRYPWMRVCDSKGRLVAGQVAAVILAPGPALAHQSRSGATPDVDQFLESTDVTDAKGQTSQLSNGDYDSLSDSSNGMRGSGECRESTVVDGVERDAVGEEFVIPVGAQGEEAGVINDQLTYITADEIINAVQQRAMREVVRALKAHRDEVVAGGGTRGRFPWMSPFANPREGRSNADADQTTLALEGQVEGGGIDVLRDDQRVFGAHLVGAAIRNLTTGASAVVISVSNPPDNYLRFSPLLGGMDANAGSSPNDRFSVGDNYQIASFRGDAKGQTREGQVPFHHPDEAEDRATRFSVAWDFALADAELLPTLTVLKEPPASASSYRTNLLEFIRRSRLVGEVTVEEGGVCRVDGLASGLVRCQGRMIRSPYLKAIVAAEANNDNITLTSVTDALDTTAQPFQLAQWGVGRGDRLRNLTDGSQGIVASLEPSSGKALRVVALSGGTDNQLSPGDEVNVEPAAQVFTGTATGGSGTTLEDTSRAEGFVSAGMAVGDVLVNITDGSYAFITAVNATAVTFTALVGGADGIFEAGDQYEIRSDFVVQRRITFDLYYSGAETKQASALNLRSISVGNEATPGRLSGLPVLPATALADNQPLQYVQYAVRVDDLGGDGTIIGTAVADVSNGGQGTDVYLSTRDIERDFIIGKNIPQWFHENSWHEFIYVAVSNGFSPSGIGNCYDRACIDVFNRRQSRKSQAQLNYTNTVHVVVVGSGASVSDAVLRPKGQIRPSADAADYYEEENAQVSVAHAILGGLGDDQFEADPMKAAPSQELRPASEFNDAVIAICANTYCEQ